GYCARQVERCPGSLAEPFAREESGSAAVSGTVGGRSLGSSVWFAPRTLFLLRLLARLPEFFRRRRHVEMGAGAAGNRIGDRVHHRGDRGGGAGLARALDAERV